MATTIPLSAVADLLNEFNHHSTSNARKHDIEKQLVEYQNSSNAWSQCLYHISNGTANSPSMTNQYVWFFTASTIEMTITRKWKYLDETDRQRLRETLWNSYAAFDVNTIPRLEREKIAQIIALMGKREYPDKHSAYMCHLIELLKSNFVLGITLLRTTSEEVVSTRDDITSDRRKYFHSNVNARMPDVFQLLQQFLAMSTAELMGGSAPHNRVTSAFELLNCLQHLFTWTLSEELLTEQFLMNLLGLAIWNVRYSDVSMVALGNIAELFYRQRTLPFPHIIASGIRNILKQRQLNATNELYQDKLTELMRLFMAQQWSKWIDDEVVFPEIVSALHTFTFENYGALEFTEKLDVWHPMIKGLASTGFGRYTQTMHLLVAGILQKIQFRLDSDLSILDNESLDDDMQTEWQQYLTQCIETIALVAEVLPLQVFEQVYAEWLKPFEIFESLKTSIDSNGMLTINDNQRSHLVYCILRDLSSLCQTLTRLAPILQGGLHEIPKNLSQITYSIIYAIKFIAVNRLHSITNENASLSVNFVEIFAQLLNSIRNLLPWSPILQNENELQALIESVAQLLLPPSNVLHEPQIITLSAAQFLLNVSTAIRPRFMLDCPSFKRLIQMGGNLTYLDQQAASIVRNAIVNCFVLPWPNCSNTEQAYDRRSVMLAEYVHNVGENLLKLDNLITAHSQHDKVIKVITVVLPMLTNIVEYHTDSSSLVKQMLAGAYKDPIAKTMQVYTHFGANSDEVAVCVLNFALNIIKTLQIALGADYIREMLSIFLQTTTREQLTTNRFEAAEKLLQTLLLVVRQPGSLSMQLLPAILQFALNYMAPVLLQGRVPTEYCDVTLALYQLFDGILQNRWQFFYKSQVSRGFSPVGSDQQDDIQPDHCDQLAAILSAYGQALIHHIDPTITRTVLESLQRVHERYKLFNRSFFKVQLLEKYLVTLLNLLLSHSGVLYYDHLINILFHMGQADVNALHSTFVSVGFAYDAKNIEEICMAKDFPTFSTKLSQLVQDAKCAQLQ